MERIVEIQQLIKNFTKKSPSDKGPSDPDYKVYLSKCSRLLELDTRLNDIQNQDLMEEEIIELVTEIENEVKRITCN